MTYRSLMSAVTVIAVAGVLVVTAGRSAVPLAATDGEPPFALMVGDDAPDLQVAEWIQGGPIEKLEGGHVYVVDFWATWCKPCVASIPHVAELSQKYKGKATVIGMNIWQPDPAEVKPFVTKMGEKMPYRVALDDMEGSKAGKLVTLTTEKALRLGIADDERDTFEEVLAALELTGAEVIDFSPNWSEVIVRFLTDPVVSSLLMTIGLLGLLFEVRTPGFGVGGIIGIIALALFFGTSFIAQLANFTEVLIFLAGLTLLLVEVVAIPGFGLAGIAGIGLMLWGMYEMLLGEYPTPEQLERAFIGLNIGIIGGIIGTILLLRVFVTSKFFKKHVPFQAEEYSVALNMESLVNQVGVTLTKCMPTGKADFSGRHVNVTSRGEHIPKDTKVEVIKVEGNTAFVRHLSQTSKES